MSHVASPPPAPAPTGGAPANPPAPVDPVEQAKKEAVKKMMKTAGLITCIVFGILLIGFVLKIYPTFTGLDQLYAYIFPYLGLAAVLSIAMVGIVLCDSNAGKFGSRWFIICFFLAGFGMYAAGRALLPVAIQDKLTSCLNLDGSPPCPTARFEGNVVVVDPKDPQTNLARGAEKVYLMIEAPQINPGSTMKFDLTKDVKVIHVFFKDIQTHLNTLACKIERP